jgi:hypothetical protein
MSKNTYSNTYLVDPKGAGLLSNSVQSLHHELQIPSLVKLKEALENSDITIEKIKVNNDITQGLINMLPTSSNAADALLKPDTNSFFDSNHNLTDEAKQYLKPLIKSQNIESVAATVLLAIDDNQTKLALSETLSSTVKNYKDKLEAQTAIDTGRMVYLIKNSHGEVQPITDIDQLKNQLSAEQRGFIATWNQANFDSGWVTSLVPQEKAIEQNTLIEGSKVRNPILIDLSSAQVKLYNSVDMIAYNIHSGAKNLHSKATLEIDVSNLKGQEYNPCTTTSPFKITAIVTELDPSLPFDVNAAPRQEISPEMHHSLRKDCMRGKLAGLIAPSIPPEAKNNYLINLVAEISASEDNRKMYCDVATEQFDKFSKTYTGILDSKEKERIKKVVIDIMTPLCKDDKAKEVLEKNAGKLVRECAAQAGVKQSWSQAWSKFKDGIGNLINYITGKENPVKKIMADNPDVTEVLKKSMQNVSKLSGQDIAQPKRLITGNNIVQ